MVQHSLQRQGRTQLRCINRVDQTDHNARTEDEYELMNRDPMNIATDTDATCSATPESIIIEPKNNAALRPNKSEANGVRGIACVDGSSVRIDGDDYFLVLPTMKAPMFCAELMSPEGEASMSTICGLVTLGTDVPSAFPSGCPKNLCQSGKIWRPIQREGCKL